MLSNILQQYLVEKLIHEDHPTIEYDRCTNSKQRRKTCTVCKDVCPKGVIEYSRNIVWDDCGNCNVCVSQCPSRAIRSSAINLGKLLELYKSKAEHIVIVCRHREVQADLKIYCIASAPWEVIAYLALEKQVVILRQGCESCEDNGCLTAFEETMTRVEEFLGGRSYREQVGISKEEEIPPASLLSRREMFSLLGKRAKNAARAVIPDDGSVKIDGMVYRKLLTKRLKELYERGRKQTFGWRTRVFTKSCWGCGICARVCPHGAIAVVDSYEKKYMAHALWKCEGCGICESVCLEGGIEGIHIEYVKNPLEPVLTEIACGCCKKCEGPVKAGAGELCYNCAAKNRGAGSPFHVTAPY